MNMDKYTGKRLDGRYEIQELIGVGGMANVYKAYDSIDDRTVAIKILKEEYLGNQDFMRRFKNESKAIAMLDHPNIVKVFSVSFGDRMQYIVMEYIDGITLKEYVDRQNTVHLKEAIHFTVQILKALQHAHENGIIHRDIKPQNIMLLRDGSIKVTDFGIARFSDSQTRTMTDKAIGSVHYIAPEQARGDLTDGKTDVYSVGVMLYEMITGQLPFEADNAVSVAIMQLQTEPKPPREINPAIPIGLEEITLKAMRKTPAERYPSARAMLEDLSTFRRDPTVQFHYQYAADTAPTKVVTPSPKPSPRAEAPSIDEHPTQTIPTVPQPEVQYRDHYTYRDTPEPEQPPKKKTGLIVGLCAGGGAVLAAIVVILVLVFGGGGGTNTGELFLKDYIGQNWEDVQKELDSDAYAGLHYTVSYQESNDVEKGKVLTQSPNGGKNVKSGTEVTFTVSSGDSNIEVPNVTNYSEVDAVAELTRAGFRCSVKELYDNQIAQGKIIKTSPEAGTKAPKDSTVTLYISKGVQKISVPNVVGYGLDNAKQEIERANLSVGYISYAYSDSVDEGEVISTDPIAGTQLEKGAAVNLVVSQGREEKVLHVTINLPPISGSLSLTAFVDGSLEESTTVTPSSGGYGMEFTGTGVQNLEVYLDGGLYATYTLDYTNGRVTQTGSYSYDGGSQNNSKNPDDDYNGYVDPDVDEEDYGDISN